MLIVDIESEFCPTVQNKDVSTAMRNLLLSIAPSSNFNKLFKFFILDIIMHCFFFTTYQLKISKMYNKFPLNF